MKATCGRGEVRTAACRVSDTLPSTPCQSFDICGRTRIARSRRRYFRTSSLISPHLSLTHIETVGNAEKRIRKWDAMIIGRHQVPRTSASTIPTGSFSPARWSRPAREALPSTVTTRLSMGQRLSASAWCSTSVATEVGCRWQACLLSRAGRCFDRYATSPRNGKTLVPRCNCSRKSAHPCIIFGRGSRYSAWF
jgi:hypothetical protein